MTAQRGVVIGCDQQQEWLLKWWWNHYVEQNTFPVTLFDFGISCAARLWCQKRLNVVSFPPPRSLFLSKGQLTCISKLAEEEAWPSSSSNRPSGSFSAPSRHILWPNRVAHYVWAVRPIWFAKAFCLARSPYQETLWLDLDCEVKQSLSLLFASSSLGDGFALTRDAPHYVAAFQKCGALRAGVQGYQAGVIAFHRSSPVLHSWIDACYTLCNQEFSEQSTLSHLLHRSRFAFTSLAEDNNWLFPEIANPKAVIIHHTGASSKRRLMEKL
ncbi:MAG: hypothetical protein AAF443_00590 [Chlamydiota bacterium]